MKLWLENRQTDGPKVTDSILESGWTSGLSPHLVLLFVIVAFLFLFLFFCLAPGSGGGWGFDQTFQIPCLGGHRRVWLGGSSRREREWGFSLPCDGVR
ncbi:hypothetical protein P170DRAFT_246360 [Aspergillus steynii IBT 23096]|uniref:Uncharacterized protein n=1 Tax=Aspergillus steynii IBT 23096 TaxID=1392250 RepID=A0A2I2FY41_9EURO|nr:uncharacterized protein P170DRAFT_246360 [Aspergillus steynii IBT 23096]PLB45549.1 hypothetical protein P170DRAFT_246360 [Aspergillus steynii IBT 23096]